VSTLAFDAGGSSCTVSQNWMSHCVGSVVDAGSGTHVPIEVHAMMLGPDVGTDPSSQRSTSWSPKAKSDVSPNSTAEAKSVADVDGV